MQKFDPFVKDGSPVIERAPTAEDLKDCTPVDNTPLTSTCHCESFSLTLPGKPPYINECQCGICYRYGAEWGYYLRKDVVFRKTEGASTKKYLWGAKKIGFHACANCHCLLFWFPEVIEGEDGKRGIEAGLGVNTRLVHPNELARVERRKQFEEY